MTNRYHYKVVVVFMSLMLSLAPLKAFAGGTGLEGLGTALAFIAGISLLAFLISTTIELVLLKSWKKRQSGQRALLSIILVSYSIFYIPFILWLILRMSFNWLYFQFVNEGVIYAILALSTILVVGLFLLKEFYSKRFKAVLWLSSGYVLVLTALLYIGTAVYSSIFMKYLSESGVKSYITIPIILAAIMLVGAKINTAISNNIKKVNVLFIIMFFLAVMLMRIDHEAFAFWADVSIVIAWLLQRKSTRNCNSNEIYSQNDREGPKIPMNKISIRVCFVILFVLGMLLTNFGFGRPIGSALWGSLWAIAFAVGIVYFTGRALVFVPVVMLMLTVVLPFVIICRSGLDYYGSWSASASEAVLQLRHVLPLGGLALFVPTIMATIAVWFFGNMSLTKACKRPPSAAPDA